MATLSRFLKHTLVGGLYFIGFAVATKLLLFWHESLSGLALLLFFAFLIGISIAGAFLCEKTPLCRAKGGIISGAKGSEANEKIKGESLILLTRLYLVASLAVIAAVVMFCREYMAANPASHRAGAQVLEFILCHLLGVVFLPGIAPWMPTFMHFAWCFVAYYTFFYIMTLHRIRKNTCTGGVEGKKCGHFDCIYQIGLIDGGNFTCPVTEEKIIGGGGGSFDFEYDGKKGTVDLGEPYTISETVDIGFNTYKRIMAYCKCGICGAEQYIYFDKKLIDSYRYKK